MYASWLSLDLSADSAVESVKATAGQGFAFTKWALREAEADELVLLAERAAEWAGQSVAVDALGTWGHTRSREVARRLNPEAVRWVEDPLPRTDLAAYTLLRRQTKGLPVAVGERLSCLEEVAVLLRRCRPEAFTFDAVWCGGITEARDWVGVAHDAGVPVHLHGRAFLPAVHLAAAFPHAAGAVEYQVVWEPRRRADAARHAPAGGRACGSSRPARSRDGGAPVMPRHTGELAVRGRLERREGAVLLVVDERLSGHDTFLSTTLRLDQPVRLPDLPVQILTFDDVTVLAPLVSVLPQSQDGDEWGGTLLIPHGARPPTIPADLAQAAAEAGVGTSGWSPPKPGTC